MAELTSADVDEFIGGDDPELAVNAALAAARRFVGWHVSPVITETVIIDGPDSRILNLPTRKVVTMIGVTEDGIDLDLDTLSWSAGGPPESLGRPCSMRKRSRGWWTDEYQGIEVEMEHGYTDVEAVDWRRAIMSMINEMNIRVGGVNEDMLIRKTVDDVTYGFANPFATAATDALYSVEHMLTDFALPRLEYL